MKVVWEIDDGCAGGRSEYVTDVDDDELAECETDAEREDIIAEFIENDFRLSVSWIEVSREDK